jgi:hypothetical protein
MKATATIITQRFISVSNMFTGISFFLLISLCGFSGPESLSAQNVSINSAGHASAILDVNAGNKGMLIPRVSLTSAIDAATIPSPETSLLVYNTATAGSPPNDVIPGFYFWNSMKWLPFVTGQPGALAYADFYALMPGDNPATVAVGSDVEFPQDGPASGGIVRISQSEFLLPDIGTYQVSWQVSVSEPGQLVLGLDSGAGVVELSETVVGRATGTSQISGSRIISTSVVNSVLSVRNPASNSTALTITPVAGGSEPVSASLVIVRLQ